MQEGMGALHLAAAKGCDEIVQELLDAGVAPDMQDKVANLICITYIVQGYILRSCFIPSICGIAIATDTYTIT